MVAGTVDPMEQELTEHHAPLPGRVGHVAGIESLTLDGHRYYFGFDFRSDLVVSPLIADPDAMAAFAAKHLRQVDGRHDEAYWADLVSEAVEYSELVADDADREFTTAGLRAELPEPDSHLLYLLDAVSDWDDESDLPPDVQQAYERLGFEEDEFAECIDECLEAVLEEGSAARSDEWTVLRFYLTSATAHLPGNWVLLFGPLGFGSAGQSDRSQSSR